MTHPLAEKVRQMSRQDNNLLPSERAKLREAADVIERLSQFAVPQVPESARPGTERSQAAQAVPLATTVTTPAGTAPAPAALPEEPVVWGFVGGALVRFSKGNWIELCDYKELRAFALAQREENGRLRKELDAAIKDSYSVRADVRAASAESRAAQLQEKLDAANAALNDYANAGFIIQPKHTEAFALAAALSYRNKNEE